MEFESVLMSVVNTASETVQPQGLSPIKKVNGMISIGSIEDLPTLNVDDNEVLPLLEAYLILTSDSSSLAKAVHPENAYTPRILVLEMLPGRKSEADFLRNILPRSLEFIRVHLQEARRKICIACVDGKDHSVGVATAALQMFFDDAGHMLHPTSMATHGIQGRNSGKPSPRPLITIISELGNYCSVVANKASIRTRLQWIIASRPEANPSRATLKRVNEFLLSPSRSSFRNTSPSVVPESAREDVLLP